MNLFPIYSTMNGMLTEIKTDYASSGFDYFAEIKAFVDSVATREPNQAHIDKAILTSKLLDAIYRSSDEQKEIIL